MSSLNFSFEKHCSFTIEVSFFHELKRINFKYYCEFVADRTTVVDFHVKVCGSNSNAYYSCNYKFSLSAL